MGIGTWNQGAARILGATVLATVSIFWAGCDGGKDSGEGGGKAKAGEDGAAQEAAKQAYKMAGVTASDIDVAEVHDCFTIAELMAYEDLGFAAPGQGKELIKNKQTYKEGSIPVNVDGGLLSKGHPIGATGGSQIRTIVLQLRDEAGDIQVDNPQIGLVHNIGGVGLYGNVTILGR